MVVRVIVVVRPLAATALAHGGGEAIAVSEDWLATIDVDVAKAAVEVAVLVSVLVTVLTGTVTVLTGASMKINLVYTSSTYLVPESWV